jgi:hypothetical protein
MKGRVQDNSHIRNNTYDYSLGYPHLPISPAPRSTAARIIVNKCKEARLKDYYQPHFKILTTPCLYEPKRLLAGEMILVVPSEIDVITNTQ